MVCQTLHSDIPATEVINQWGRGEHTVWVLIRPPEVNNKAVVCHTEWILIPPAEVCYKAIVCHRVWIVIPLAEVC